MSIKIEICPVKRLYQILREQGAEGVAAIISISGNAPDKEQLYDIPYVYTIYRDIDYKGSGAFSNEDATRFADFVRNLGSEISTLYCVCDAAMSRSPAVAAAVSRYFDIDSMDSIWRNPHYKPNMWVFEKLSTALGVPVSDAEMDQYVYESNWAFRRAVAAVRED